MESWLENFARANFRRSADTAHDLKTPLNVAVLNLELLRMRLRKIADDGDDEKISSYTSAIELELRRMGHIFDAFFLLSTPPAAEGDPSPVDIAPIVADAATNASIALDVDGPVVVIAHERRIREAVKLFFEGAAKLFRGASGSADVRRDEHNCHITVVGEPVAADFEKTKIFKFYYTGPDGNPDLSLAVARLITETYGGEVNAEEDRDKVSLRLSFPLGAR
ncbi:MAG TPA: HAMP domain-containing sensor histidine kinase [Thermoanaerobaculia bacterium]|nr:HAMP domain-containing sensor histidine kinase [Thermoanaerobaculia bacterium]